MQSCLQSCACTHLAGVYFAFCSTCVLPSEMLDTMLENSRSKYSSAFAAFALKDFFRRVLLGGVALLEWRWRRTSELAFEHTQHFDSSNAGGMLVSVAMPMKPTDVRVQTVIRHPE